MKIKLPSIFTNMVWYTFFLFFKKMIPFLLLPIFSRLFTSEELGYYMLFQSVILIAYPILTCGTDSSISINFFKLDKHNFSIYLSNVMYLVTIIAIFVFLVLIGLSLLIDHIFNISTIWLSAITLIVLLQYIIQIQLSLYRNQNKIFGYGILSVLTTLLGGLSGLTLVFYTNMSWEGVILGLLFGDIIGAIYSLTALSKGNYFKFEKAYKFIGDAYRIGIPISVHQLGVWLSNAYNRFVINFIIGVAATGDYGIGSVFGMVMTFIQEAFNLAFAPYLYNQLKINNTNTQEKLFNITFVYYLIITFSGIIIAFMGLNLMGYIFGDKYTTMTSLVIPLVAASMVNGYYKAHVNYLFFYKKTRSIAKITLLLGIANIPISYIMVKIYGIVGAAYASLIIQFLTYIFIVSAANKIYPINWRANLINIRKSSIWISLKTNS